MADTPAEVALRYFACIGQRDIDGLARLYAADAVFTLPDGREFRGAEAIRGMHEAVFAAASPMPSPIAMIVSEDAVAVEIEARLPDGRAKRTANFYRLNGAGKIVSLSIYVRTG